MSNRLMRKKKVPPKVRKLNALTMEVWDTILKSVLGQKIYIYKKFMQTIWSDSDSKDSAFITSEDQGTILMTC